MKICGLSEIIFKKKSSKHDFQGFLIKMTSFLKPQIIYCILKYAFNNLLVNPRQIRALNYQH